MAKSLQMLMMTHCLILVLYVLQSTFTSGSKFYSSNQSLSHDDECTALFQFSSNMSTNNSASSDPRAYTKITSWKLNRTNGGRDCCLWNGVECHSGRVIGLDLSSSFLYGPIHSTSSLFNLIHLRRLNLADNDFSFSLIPSGVGRLSQLANLDLSYSLFSGRVPEQISHLRRLVSLDLTGNLLELQSPDFQILVENSIGTLRELFLSEVIIDSQVPNILANSSSLTSLVLRDCGLHGEFPTPIFNLPTLQHIDVKGNSNLTGFLPNFQAKSQLQSLILSETKFHGMIPASIGNLIHLNHLDLSTCSFEGPLPGSVSNLTQLTYLNLNMNNFWGPVPTLARLSKLRYLLLSFNEFDGKNLSDWLGKLQELSYLDLKDNKLGCEIPSSIGNLTQLKQLHLNYNSMIGQIPSSLMNLTQLTALILGFNEFTGHLPNLERLVNLTYLSLTYNNFDRWKLPYWIGRLNKLTDLDLYHVNLFGEIPSSIFNLTQVEELDMASNQIDGPFPSFPSTMTKLTTLSLASNQLKGPITSSLSDLKNLEILLLSDNNISGAVDIDIFLSLKKLKALYLDRNKITLSVKNSHPTDALPEFEILELEYCNLRVFPDFLRSQNQLQELYLDGNDIDGLIPEWMGNISKDTLQTLTLSQNMLTGFEQHWPVLPWVGLVLLDLSHNMLHGSIPMPPPNTINILFSNNKLSGEISPSICDLQSLQLLDLSFNNITGSIPPCLEKLSNSLLVLNLRGNSLQGTIPNRFHKRSMLKMINLSENQLEGQLPRSLENCSSLQILDLGNNLIEDTFPYWLGALSQLNVLILRSNKFHGVVRIASKTDFKFPKLRIIDFSNNSFSGNLPQQYFNEWSAMKKAETIAEYMETTIDILLANYMWVGNYSYSMKMNNKGLKMEYEKVINILIAVDLSSNKFGGKIPKSIKELNGLQLLNLSNNMLSGVIPPSMGNLTHLESLDLSSNKLSGNIPQELAQLNFLAFLNVSNNNLTGHIPAGRQFDTFMNSSYMGNPALCGDPLSKKCRYGRPEVSKPPTVLFDEDTESNFPHGVDWVVILSGVGSGLVIGLLFGNQVTTRLYWWFLRRFKY